MKITTKGSNAIKALLDLVNNYDGQAPITLKDISERQHIPLNYLEQLFRKLRIAEIVTTSRGRTGGYLLKSKVEEIAIIDILRCVGEKPFFSKLTRKESETKEAKALYDIFDSLETSVKSILNTPISELIKRD